MMVVGGSLRVAIVAPPFYEIPPSAYGGIEAVCGTLVHGLVRRGHDVTLISVGRNRSLGRFVQTRSEPCPEGHENDAIFEIIHAARAAAILSDLRPDVVHDHTRAGPLTAPSRGQPTLVTVHAPVVGPDSNIEYWEAIQPWVSLVAVSAAQRASAPNLNWAATIHHGIAEDKYCVASAKSDYVLYLGRLSPLKGVHLAIDAARAAGRRIVIAGSWTIASERVYFDSVIRPRLGPGVEWVGEVGGQAKVDLLGQAACLLFPVQWQEPFGLVMLEAMACGTPVVGLPFGSVAELITQGVTGIVCERPADLPAGIARATQIDPIRCREESVRRFGAETMVAAYEDVYRTRLAATRLTVEYQSQRRR
jgi:glycosyltransferase involved in cell wall biosynthesis